MVKVTFNRTGERHRGSWGKPFLEDRGENTLGLNSALREGDDGGDPC